MKGVPKEHLYMIGAVVAVMVGAMICNAIRPQAVNDEIIRYGIVFLFGKFTNGFARRGSAGGEKD